MLPSFDGRGLLPQGDYPLTLPQLRDSFLVRGSSAPGGEACVANWDSAWREQLVDNLETLAAPLWKIGVESLWIDGSFVENKAHPGDIDGYFECHPAKVWLGELERDLIAASEFEDAERVWTWSVAAKRSSEDSPVRKLPLWHRFRVELYPHYPGLLTGLNDHYGRALEFPAAFRLSRGFRPKGIIQLLPG